MAAQTWCPCCYGPLLKNEGSNVKCKRCGAVMQSNGVIVQQGDLAIAIAAAKSSTDVYKGAVNDAPVYDLTRREPSKRVAEVEAMLVKATPHGHLFHTLYQTGDGDAPDSIKDRNGDVVLGLCRICGRGEADLIEPCTPKPKNCTHRGCANYMIRPCKD